MTVSPVTPTALRIADFELAVGASNEVFVGLVDVVVVAGADEGEVFDVGESAVVPFGEVVDLAPFVGFGAALVLAVPVAGDDGQALGV